MHSQNNEEEVILKYFHNYGNGHAGKFIDLGAFDPKVFSNTRALFEIGWTGIYVEPSPICFEKFKEEYATETRIQLLNYAIAEQDGIVMLYDASGESYSTIDIAFKNKLENSGAKFNLIQVPTMSMSKLISQFGQDVDFISIDIGSKNYNLLNLLRADFLHRLKMICINHDGYYPHMESILCQFGFKRLLLNENNLIMVK